MPPAMGDSCDPLHAPAEERCLDEKTLEVPGEAVPEEAVAAKVEEISDEDGPPEPQPVLQPQPTQAVAPGAGPVMMPVAVAAPALPADFPPKKLLVDKNLGLGNIEEDLEKALEREMSKIGIPCPKDSAKAVDEALAAESVSLAEALPGDKDLRKAQLAMKASNKEAAEAKRKAQEEEKEAKKAAKAEKNGCVKRRKQRRA